MAWLYLTLVAVMGFMLVKVRRRRKVRQAENNRGYSNSAAA
jgi:hypothetical protein